MTVHAFPALPAADVERVRRLAATAAQADGHPPLSEQVLLHLSEPGEHLLASRGEEVVGYAHLDEDGTAELVVAPAARREGVGSALLAALPPQGVRIWAHGDSAASRALGERSGMRRGRVLHQMRRPLADLPAGRPLPDGVTVRTFVVGQDEQAWLELNALAFADHPEQGRWTGHDVLLREQAEWFDAQGFLLAERDGRLVGSHWTKTHTDEQPPVGEVYVVAVHPSEQGSGLGSAITLAGLEHLQSRGLSTVLLYVDEDNPAAVRVYTRLGFTVHATDVQWVR